MKIDRKTMAKKVSYVTKRVKERKSVTLAELQAELVVQFGHTMGGKKLSETVAAARAAKAAEEA